MSQRNRGKKSSDDKIFAPKWWPIFKEAVDDYSYLLSRGYSDNAVGQIVGNRYRLNARQRMAIQRISAGEEQIRLRAQKACQPSDLEGQSVEIDGFNLLILLESALSGAYVFKGRDQTLRDISSVHGTYKRVTKTEEAILMVGKALKELKMVSVKWYLDQPVSNSGRLKQSLLTIADRETFNWEVELVYNPDKTLVENRQIVVSSDSWVLDHADRWFNLGAWIVSKYVPAANLIIV